MPSAYSLFPSHATDSKGNAAPFSSSDSARRTALICTLGEAVPSSEDVPKAQYRKNKGRYNDQDRTKDAEYNEAPNPALAPPPVTKIHRSGTSFATPLVVATAALVLGFMDSAEAALDKGALPKDFAALRPRLRTLSGMERVLGRMCVEEGKDLKSGFLYVAPWFFLEMEELSRVGIITNTLRKSPE